jgi:dCTP deaminase
MILTGNEIIKQYQNGNITLNPFNINHITTNSYDLRLGDTLLKYTDTILDPKVDNSYELISIPQE